MDFFDCKTLPVFHYCEVNPQSCSIAGDTFEVLLAGLYVVAFEVSDSKNIEKVVLVRSEEPRAFEEGEPIGLGLSEEVTQIRGVLIQELSIVIDGP